MKRFGLALLAVMALVVVAASPAMAQVRYGVSAGLLMPMGDYNTADKPGFVGGVGATYWLPTGNIGIRGDVSYGRTSHDGGVGGNTKIIGGMASVVYALTPSSAPARVVITGGLGLYNVDIEVTGPGASSFSETKVGFGAGAAVLFKLGTGGTRLSLGSRFTSVSTSGTSTSFLPITVGLSFGK